LLSKLSQCGTAKISVNVNVIKKLDGTPVTVKSTDVLHHSTQRKSGFKQVSFEETLENGNTGG
jgi:hypothetical protein